MCVTYHALGYSASDWWAAVGDRPRSVRPKLATANRRDLLAAQVKLFAEPNRALSFGIPFPDPHDLSLCHLIAAAALAGRRSPFCDHVGEIICVSPKRQVPRVNAAPVVAGMHYNEPFGDRSMVQLIGVAVSADDFGIADAEPAVAGGSADIRLPIPAFILTATRDLLPKSLRQCFLTLPSPIHSHDSHRMSSL